MSNVRDNRSIEAELMRVAELCLAGDLLQAGRLVEDLLRVAPRDLRARFYLGEIKRRAGDFEGAMASFKRVLDGGIRTAQVYVSKGLTHRRLAQAGDARRCFERAVALEPCSAEALGNLGNLHFEAGEDEQALLYYRRALAADASNLRLCENLAATLIATSRLDEAAALLLRAWPSSKDPPPRELMLALASELQTAERFADSQPVFERLLALAPGDPEALNGDGRARFMTGDFAGARASFLRAVALAPADPLLHFHLGAAHRICRAFDDAAAALATALQLIDTAERPAGKTDAANLRLRVEQELAFLALENDRFEEGWSHYRGRWFAHAEHPEDTLQPRLWQGEPLAGRRLVIAREQGIGDEIQFASLYGELVRTAASVVVQCSQRLEPAFRRSFPGATFWPCEETPDAWQALRERLAPDDLVTFAGGLPRWQRRTRADFAPAKAFLRPDPAAVAQWRERLAALGDGRRIGISWRGGTGPNFSAQRSIALADLVPAIPSGAVLVDLQYTDCSIEIAHVRQLAGVSIAQFADMRDDLEATINLVAALDLVITVQTAVAHLAGALGVKTWVLVPRAPSTIRWLAANGRTPWYSSVSLLEQVEPGDWQPVLARLSMKLKAAQRGQRSRNNEAS